MGMPVRVEVRDAGGADLEPVFAWLRRVDALFSPYRPGSEVARLARGERFAPHPLVREVLQRCEALRVQTRGWFDAYATGRLDPCGYVKGWAVDGAAALLEADAFCIDAGGDVLVRGGPWRIGIRHPRRRDRLAAALAVSDAAVATSGLYERGAHIVDPRTGTTPRGVLSVTVVGPRLATADAYATAAFAMGADGPAWTAGLRDHRALTILADGRVLTTVEDNLRLPLAA